MSDEIVCETVAAFLGALGRAHGVHLWGNPTHPGDSVTFGGATIVYRPPPPKPCCPRCGSRVRGGYVTQHLRDVDFHAACYHDGDYHPWHVAPTPPPARDEAPLPAWCHEEAAKAHGYRGPMDADVAVAQALHRAFLAGRASVKP